MNSLKNQVHLIGNLGMDVEFKSLDSGNKLAKFSLATTEKFKNKEGEQKEETQWHQITAWGGLADSMNEFLAKGDHVAILGKIKYSQYEDKNGEKKFGTSIQASEFVKLSPKATAPF